jgi:MFS family permease
VACLVLAVGTVLVVAVLSDVVGTYLAVRRVGFVLPLLLLAAAAGLLGLWERLASVATGPAAGAVAGAVAAVLLVTSVIATAHVASSEKSGWREGAVQLQAAAPGTTAVLGPFSATWYPEVEAYMKWLGVDRTLLRIDDVDAGTWRPGVIVLWLTAEPVSAPGFSTEALNRVDRLEIIAGDANWGMVKLPVYLSRSRPSSEAELLAQRDLVAGLGWALRAG